MNPVIKLINVSAGYRAGNPVIQNINLELAEREFLGIIGPNGGGKTTLLKVIIGLLKPFSGEIILGENSKNNLRSQIGYVPQYSQFDKTYPIKVRNVVSMGFISKSIFSARLREEDVHKTEEALKKVNLAII